MGCRKPTLVLLLVCFLFAARPTRPDPGLSGDVLAFVHVNVVPMDRERVLADQTVLVRDGRILQIGPASQVKVPDGAIEIHGSGKYLMPGLADMHMHLWHEGDLLLYVANGVTTVRSLFGNPEHLQWRNQINSGQRLGPTLYTSGPILDGDPPTWSTSRVVTSEEEAARAVSDQREAGYDGVKVYENLSPEVYDTILAAAKKQAMPVWGHVPIRVGLRKALAQGQRSVEHMMDFVYALLPEDSPAREEIIRTLTHKNERNTSLFVTPYEHADATRIPALAKEVVASGVWICPTLVVAQKAARDPEDIAALAADAAMAYIAPEVRAFWKDSDSRLQKEHVDITAMKLGVALEFRGAEALHRAGAKLLVGSDAPNPYDIPGISIHEELKNFVSLGMTPFLALRAATAAPAEFLGATAEFGTVAVGRRADLILVEDNPLKDVANVAKRAGVMVRGKWFPGAKLQEMLDELGASYVGAKK